MTDTPKDPGRRKDLEAEVQLPPLSRSGGARLAGSAAKDVQAAIRDPVVGILVVAGFFDGISDNWVHACFLGAVAAALASEAARERRGLASSEPVTVFSKRESADPSRRMLL